jgi:hypothetical protein
MARGLRLHQQWEHISWTQVYNSKRPVSIYVDVCAVIAENSVYQPRGIGNTSKALAWEKLICQMISLCARETTFGHVMMLWKYKP